MLIARNRQCPWAWRDARADAAYLHRIRKWRGNRRDANKNWLRIRRLRPRLPASPHRRNCANRRRPRSTTCRLRNLMTVRDSEMECSNPWPEKMQAPAKLQMAFQTDPFNLQATLRLLSKKKCTMK